MNSITRKLILGVLSLSLTAVCLTSTTYAWFARNAEAWTDEFEFDIESYDGLLISVDGEHYRSSIPNVELKKAILAYSLEKDINTINNDEVDKLFKDNMVFKDVTTHNLVDFTTIDQTNKDDDGYYRTKEANKTNYFKFDLYFRIDTHGVAQDNYDLTFVSKKYMDSEDEALITHVKSEDTYGNVLNTFTAGGKEYKPNDKIDFNLKDAIRIGVIHEDSKKNQISTIYEPYIGHGSYPIDGETEENSNYNPANNLMLQHINSYGGGLRPLSDNKEIYKGTEKDFENEISLGEFKVKDNKYEDVKITVCIWLEGMDSDYFAAVANPSLSFKLAFRKREVASL